MSLLGPWRRSRQTIKEEIDERAQVRLLEVTRDALVVMAVVAAVGVLALELAPVPGRLRLAGFEILPVLVIFVGGLVAAVAMVRRRAMSQRAARAYVWPLAGALAVGWLLIYLPLGILVLHASGAALLGSAAGMVIAIVVIAFGARLFPR